MVEFGKGSSVIPEASDWRLRLDSSYSFAILHKDPLHLMTSKGVLKRVKLIEFLRGCIMTLLKIKFQISTLAYVC